MERNAFLLPYIGDCHDALTIKLEGNGPVESAASRAIKYKHEVH